MKLSYELSQAAGNDRFSIYIKNETYRELLDDFTKSSDGEITYSNDISKWIGWNFTIEFNLNTNSHGTDKGVTIDDFMIKGNSSLIIYENDFESNLIGWIHINHSGAEDLWHIAIEEVGGNRPVIDVVYQDSIYKMVGEKPSISGIDAYPKLFFDKDPLVQPKPTSYLVYYAEGPIENNFTIKLTVNNFDPVSISNQIKFTNDFAYVEAVQQGNEIVNSTKTLNRPRWYYKIKASNLDSLIIELSENSILIEHDTISIAFYDKYGQTPFKISDLKTYTLYEGLSIFHKVKTSGMIIVSITGLTYNDYIELNIHGTSVNFDPIIITILSITSIAFGALAFLIYRKYLKISKQYSSLKISSDVMQEKSKMKPSINTENAKKPPFSQTFDSNNNKHGVSNKTLSKD